MTVNRPMVAATKISENGNGTKTSDTPEMTSEVRIAQKVSELKKVSPVNHPSKVVAISLAGPSEPTRA